MQIDSSKVTKQSFRTVVRVRTSWYSDRKGLYQKKSLTWLRRKSEGVNPLEEDISNVGAEEAGELIKNLDQVSDGIYELVFTPLSRYFETGYTDDWDYKLVPYVDTDSSPLSTLGDSE